MHRKSLRADMGSDSTAANGVIAKHSGKKAPCASQQVAKGTNHVVDRVLAFDKVIQLVCSCMDPWHAEYGIGMTFTYRLSSVGPSGCCSRSGCIAGPR